MKYATFNDRSIQQVPNSVAIGGIPTLSDPTKVADKGTIPLVWCDIVQLVALLSEEKKSELLKILGLNAEGTKDTTPPRLVLLDELAEVTKAGEQTIALRIYLDD